MKTGGIVKRALGAVLAIGSVAVSLTGAQQVATAAPTPSPIVNGTVQSTSTYPWMVSLQSSIGGGPVSGHFCGGTLITPTAVLTAAHCVDIAPPNGVLDAIEQALFQNFVDVVIGRTDLNSTAGAEFDVSTVVLHPDWNRANFANDAAIVFLTAPSSARTMQIPTTRDTALARSTNLHFIAGWGARFFGDVNPPNLLQWAWVFTQSDAQCAATTASSSFVGSVMVCALGRADRTNPASLQSDTCQGDSGGPLFVSTPADNRRGSRAARDVQFGITSFGVDCGKNAGVYTEVLSPGINSWIRQTAGL